MNTWSIQRNREVFNLCCDGRSTQTHLPHLHHLLPAVLILPLPLQHLFFLGHNLKERGQDVRKLKWKERKYDLDLNFSDKLLLVQCPASGPVLWAGGDSPLRCSQRSGNTASSWSQWSPWQIPRLCAASRSQQKGERGKETLQNEPNQTKDGTSPSPHTLLQDLLGQIAKQRQTASKRSTKHNTHVDEAG